MQLLEQITKCCYYIDDSLVINRNYSDCRNETQLIVSVLDKLGFTIYLKKSILEPTHRIIFFGLLIDSVQYKVFLTDEKITKIVSLCQKILREKYVPIRIFASMIGLVAMHLMPFLRDLCIIEIWKEIKSKT